MALPAGALAHLVFDDEGVPTPTSIDQIVVEDSCLRLLCLPAERGLNSDEEDGDSAFGRCSLRDAVGRVTLRREQHVAFLLSSLRALPASYVSLDSSRPWIAYWCLHALDLLGVRPVELFPLIVDWLARCRSAGGGFCGGAGQAPHAATTYASVLALLVIGTPGAYAVIDRAALHRRFLSWRAPGGGFRVQDGGEVDVRGSFTVLAVASLLGALSPQLAEGADAFLLSCQTYEGGFGGEPGAEAHGGYTFCALGALTVLGRAHAADLRSLGRWAALRQMALEGGFQGRTNKLVDSCYSFWQGATFDILAGLSGVGEAPPFDRPALARYVLCCAQEAEGGGLRDKPGKRRDQYHSCYALAGLSIAQHAPAGGQPLQKGPAAAAPLPADAVAATHPVFNIRLERVAAARAHFASLPLPY